MSLYTQAEISGLRDADDVDAVIDLLQYSNYCNERVPPQRHFPGCAVHCIR
jgi:hypothetical protein